jgi:DNA methyltransferase 1-associated protein 1
LQLRHWKRHKPNKPRDHNPDAMEIENSDPDAPEPYRFAKYNVDISVPQYDDEKYNAHLLSTDWSREETDYLMALVKEYAQKWPIVIDRYEWPPDGVEVDPTAVARAGDARTLEQLKARYYQVWVGYVHRLWGTPDTNTVPGEMSCSGAWRRVRHERDRVRSVRNAVKIRS